MNDLETRVSALLKAGAGDPPNRIQVQGVLRRRARLRLVAAVQAATASGAFAAVAVGAVAYSASGPNQNRPSFPMTGQFTAITATSSASAWAVGYTGTQQRPSPLIEHWDGSSWQQTTLPAGLGHADLLGIAAAPQGNAWAVGYITGTAPSVVMLHWDGRSWRRVPLPWHPCHGMLTAVAATSASNAWAFGVAEDNKGNLESSQGLHWNGSRWQLTPGLYGPVGRVGVPSEVALGSAGSGWAVGSADVTGPIKSSKQTPKTVAWQLRGGTWHRATVPGLAEMGFAAVAATGPADAFATAYGSGIGEVIDHWNGTKWAQTSTYGNWEQVEDGLLSGIAALSANNAWAVGERLPKMSDGWQGSSLGPSIIHWNGHRWTRSVTPALRGASLSGVTATSPANAWAIGQTGSDHPLILHWNGHAWTQQL